MRVNYNFCQQNNAFLNVNSINRGLMKDDASTHKIANNKQKHDRVSISPQSKMMNMVENLTKQKETIIEKKNKLMSRTMENGGSMESIQGQLDLYTQQLEDIDKQISDLYAQQAQTALEQGKEKKTDKADENKSEDQLEAEHLNKLAQLSEDIKHSEKVLATKDRVEGEVHVKESEVGLGELRIDVLESKTIYPDDRNGVKALIANEKQAVNQKRELISDLQDTVSQLDSSFGDQLKDVISDLDESKETTDASEPNSSDADSDSLDASKKTSVNNSTAPNLTAPNE